MSEKHLTTEDFFVRLSELFESRRDKDHGSIYLTQKCLSHATSSNPKTSPTNTGAGDSESASPSSILVRATNGKSKEHRKEKIKISTVVDSDALDTFFTRYAEICKSGMQALKKRDRSGRKKAKAKKRRGPNEASSEKKT
ncbi:MAG: hypothetical protein M1833_005097 [Piccolia ochrophora]|nr:MAG: hypothetical protein M1833_005097 [Piccolia ochrophora]